MDAESETLGRAIGNPRPLVRMPLRKAEDTVLVIGAAGLVGSHVAGAFDRERVVRTYHRTPVSGGVELDLMNEQAVRALISELRPQTVVLAAAEPWVERCEREPGPTRRLNVEAAQAVVSMTRDLGAMLVVFSSEYVFDGASGPYDEDDDVAPLNEYGRQKIALEELARTSPHHLVCRTSGVFGWERAGKNFVCQMLAHARAGERFRVPSDQVITPTYAPDLAAAVAELVRRGDTGTFHVVGPKVVARPALARSVAEVFGLPTVLIEERPTSEMGYAAPRPLSAGLTDGKMRVAIGHGLRPPEAALAAMRAIDRGSEMVGQGPAAMDQRIEL